MEIPLPTNSYRQDALKISAQRCLNAYAEFQQPNAKARITLSGSPGITELSRIGTGPIRALFEMEGVGYAVSGSQFFTFDETGAATLVGSGITGGGALSIDGDGFEIALTTGSIAFVYNLATNNFTQIIDPDFFPANTVRVINFYFAWDRIGTNQFFLSDLLDATVYDPFMIASAESNPDHVVAISSRGGILIIMGKKTIEFWDHTGATDFPFQLFKGWTVDRGLIAPLAVSSEEEATFILGDDLAFYLMAGRTLRRLSTPAIEKEWETYASSVGVSDAFCFKTTYGGHTWINLTFPAAGRSWACDITNNFLWHERASYDPTGARVRWRASSSCEVYGRQIIGDAFTNKIGYLDPTVSTEFGDPIISEFVFPPIHNKGDHGSMETFELDMQTGVGLITGQGSDPQVMMDYSDDGGHTWSDAQLWRSMGTLGQRTTRLQWQGLGHFYERCIRIRISDPVPRKVIAARAPFLYFEERP